MKKGIYASISILLIILSVALVYFNKFQTPQVREKQEQQDPGGILVIGVSNDVDSFNPLFGESSLAREMIHLLLLGLADLNQYSEFVGELGHSWERSQDYHKITYYLRKDAYWSDGFPITADDVKFTFDLLSDTSVASPNSWVTDYIKQVTVIDSHTVEIEFTRAYPDQIFDTAGEIVPKHILEHVERRSIRNHEFGQHPISSGPFKLKTWVKQQFIELVPNEWYFGDKPKLSRVIFKIVPNKANLLLQLESGEVDMMIGVEPDQVERLRERHPELAIYPVSGRVYYYLGYNEKNPLFVDARVRRALTMAIDRHGIIEATLHGFGRPCTGFVPPMISWAYNDSVKELPFDLAASRQLFASAGWIDSDGDGWLDRQGKKFSFILRTNAGNRVKSDLAVIVQEQLKKVGVEVTLQSLEWTTFQKKLRKKQFEAYVGGWSAALNVDPTPIFHSSAINLFNYIGFSNKRVDELIESGRQEMDREKAARIWKQLQEVIYQEQPYTFLFWIDKIVAVHSRFHNVTPIPLSMFYGLEHWYEEKSPSD